MSKVEKKMFYLRVTTIQGQKEYLSLFQLVDRVGVSDVETLKTSMAREVPTANFSGVCGYLYRYLLNILCDIKRNHDIHYGLLQKIMQARVLYEKALYNDCFDMIARIKADATTTENHFILLQVQRLELNYLLSTGFRNTDEAALLGLQHNMRQTMKIIRSTNEQAALYELLRHRIDHKGNVRSPRERDSLNDLVISEMSIVASSGFENFEIKKLHQLFQAYYLISVGDYRSALNSFYELDKLFQKNSRLWSNPPIYYLMVLEGILENLRYIGLHEKMDYFIDKIDLLPSSSTYFQLDALCVKFLYTLFRLIDTCNFKEATEYLKEYQSSLIDKQHLLKPNRQAQLSLYVAVVYMGNTQFAKARGVLRAIISNKSLEELPLYRTIRLVNLILYYEMGEFEYVHSEARAVKRIIRCDKAYYRIENLLMRLLTTDYTVLSQNKKRLLWTNIFSELQQIREDKFENQLLRLFDFAIWIEIRFKVE